MLENLFNPQFEIEEEHELEEEVSIDEAKQVWGGFGNNATDGAMQMASGFATAASGSALAVGVGAAGVAYGGAKVGWWLGNNAVPDSVIQAGADVYGDIAY